MKKSGALESLQNELLAWVIEADLFSQVPGQNCAPINQAETHSPSPQSPSLTTNAKDSDLKIEAVTSARNPVFKVTDNRDQRCLYLKQLDDAEHRVLSLLSKLKNQNQDGRLGLNCQTVLTPYLLGTKKIARKAWLNKSNQTQTESFQAFFKSSQWGALSQVPTERFINLDNPQETKQVVNALFELHQVAQYQDVQGLSQLIGAVMSAQTIEHHALQATELLKNSARETHRIDSQRLIKAFNKTIIEPSQRIADGLVATGSGNNKVGSSGLEQSLLHGDLTDGNVFVSNWQEQTTIGLIDFEYACVGHAFWDIAMLAVELSKQTSRERLEKDYHRLIDEYAELMVSEQQKRQIEQHKSQRSWSYLVLYWLVAKAWAMQSIDDKTQPAQHFINNYDSKATAIAKMIKLNTAEA